MSESKYPNVINYGFFVLSWFNKIIKNFTSRLTCNPINLNLEIQEQKYYTNIRIFLTRETVMTQIED